MTSECTNVVAIARARHSGVTLIELLVSLVIGALLLAGAVTVYMQSRNTYTVSETAARLQEVARYALDNVESDVRLAGFWGLTNRSDFIENRASPSDTAQAVASISNNCGTNWILDVDHFIDGRDATATSGAGYNLSCSGQSPASWADVLIVRRATSDTRALEAGRVQIQSNRMRAAVFKDGTLPTGFSASPASETRDLIVNAYYISNAGNAPNGLPRYQLRRKHLVKTASGPSVEDEEVISGVDDLQVQFGVDLDGDGNVDQYVNPDSVPASSRISTARVWLRIVADDREVGFTDSTNYAYANATPGVPGDHRRRVLISKTIDIRNSRP